MKRIAMTVMLRDGRKFWECQWTDPTTERKKTQSTGETTKRGAQIWAGRKQAELEAQIGEQMDLTWANFKAQFIEQVVSPQRKKSQLTVIATLNAIETHVRPAKIASLTASVIGGFAASLRSTGITEASIKRHLSVVRTMLNWAYRMKMIREVPHIVMPRKVATMKGRAPTKEEFDRIIDKVAEVVGIEAESSWLFLINGLWDSGLRITEAMELHWTDESKLCVDLTGKRPRLKIQSESDKGGKFRLLPIAPEFAKTLLSVPEKERRGYVFNPLPSDGGPRLQPDWVSKRISEIGKAAGVKVGDRRVRMKKDGEKTDASKYASAHDFRRAFGLRWAQLVMPHVLMQLMRHESLETTQRYYLGKNADAASDLIWDAVANTSANTDEKPRQGRTSRKTQKSDT